MGLFKSKSPDKLKKGLFISGCPRSGTSLITKILDAHPDIGILMEAILMNRARHNLRNPYWSDSKQFSKQVRNLFKVIPEPIKGNKVCSPDVWSVKDILQFCSEFESYHIVWIVRDPYQNILSRSKREPEDHYNLEAKKYLPLDYSSSYATWASSWRQSIDNYWRLKEFKPSKIHLLYYDDLIEDMPSITMDLIEKLELEWYDDISKWHQMPHYDSKGRKKVDLKYKDQSIEDKMRKQSSNTIITSEIKQSLAPYSYWIERWKSRTL